MTGVMAGLLRLVEDGTAARRKIVATRDDSG